MAFPWVRSLRMELEHDDIFVEEAGLVGNQDFVRHARNDVYSACNISEALQQAKACANRFHYFRRDLFCHLCGHMVYSDCSLLCEVEARIDELRHNHCYLQFVHRVDSCVFDGEELLEALGLAVVMTDNALYTVYMTSDLSSAEELTEQLYSNDPPQHLHALDVLGQLVIAAAAAKEYVFVRPEAKCTKLRSKNKGRKRATKTQQVAQDGEGYLSQSLQVMKDQYGSLDQCLVADIEVSEYVFEFDSNMTTSEDHPMPPMLAPRKDTKQL
ncbi:hypothetical protein BBJ28_00019959 [Nothophytophthora sp. Chile5]|nr:hypothetical protein BBJ28_00019959 [Nothophytophthora sp. Chile5]